MPSYTLRWEDRVAAGSSCDYKVIRQVTQDLTTISPTSTSWTARSLGLPAGFDPVSDRLSMFMSSGSGTFYIRRFRVEGSDGSVYYGAWPMLSSVSYSASHQDGAGGQDYIGYDAGTGAGDNAVQYDPSHGTFDAAGTGLDWYFAPLVGGWMVGQVRIA